MKPLTILVDMDGVLEDLVGTWVNVLNIIYGTNVRYEDIKEWDMRKAFPELGDKQILEPLNNKSFWKLIHPIPGAVEALQKFQSDGHKVVVVTASSYETIKDKMEDVLFKYFPFIKWSDVIITEHKQMIKGDVLIDDAVHNVVGGSYIGVLVNAPYNQDFDAEANNVFRVSNWEDIGRVVSTLAEIAELESKKEEC